MYDGMRGGMQGRRRGVFKIAEEAHGLNPKDEQNSLEMC
jgi:hypothetical protein